MNGKWRMVFLAMVWVGLGAVGVRAEDVTAATEAAATEAVAAAAQAPEPYSAAADPEYKEDTLFSGRIWANGVFAAGGARASRFKGDNVCLAGGRIAWLVNHHVIVGGAGYGLTNPFLAGELEDGKHTLHLGYGGLNLGYIFWPERLVHLTFETLVGAGGIGYAEEVVTGHNSDGQDIVEQRYRGDAFFVCEPLLSLETNLSPWMRLSLGAGYRFILGADFAGWKDGDLQGPTAEIMLKLGRF